MLNEQIIFSINKLFFQFWNSLRQYYFLAYLSKELYNTVFVNCYSNIVIVVLNVFFNVTWESLGHCWALKLGKDTCSF